MTSLTDSTSPHACACSKLVTRYPTTYVISVFGELMWEVVVRFVNIGGIIDNHYLNVIFINVLSLANEVAKGV